MEGTDYKHRLARASLAAMMAGSGAALARRKMKGNE